MKGLLLFFSETKHRVLLVVLIYTPFLVPLSKKGRGAMLRKKRLVSSNTHEADYNRHILLVFLILRTQLANGLTGTPHLLVAHSLQFLLQTGTIVGLRVGVDSDLSLITSLH